MSKSSNLRDSLLGWAAVMTSNSCLLANSCLIAEHQQVTPGEILSSRLVTLPIRWNCSQIKIYSRLVLTKIILEVLIRSLLNEETSSSSESNPGAVCNQYCKKLLPVIIFFSGRSSRLFCSELGRFTRWQDRRW